MQIDKLKLTNFRKFKELNISFEKNMTVLVGLNSSGKTSVLDALKIGLWSYVSGYSLGSFSNISTGIQISDVRLQRDQSETTHPRPKNLSCDSYKEYKNISHNDILNPLMIQANPSLFDFDKKSGKLKVNENIEDETLKSLVKKTIDNLNLNCDRLCTNRLEILKNYNQEIKRARETNNTDIFEILPQKWFYKKWPSFFTTRRLLLGNHAESYLRSVDYDG